jgi:hypothetical protein
MVTEIGDLFPGLQTSGFRVTSQASPNYNCIAWAAGDTERWWWPDPGDDAAYWPSGVSREETLAAFVATFATLGYHLCESDQPEAGYERVALFTGSDGVPTHAARQLPSGRWTSKLGMREDIDHALHDLSGDVYGAVTLVLRRAVIRPAGT